MDCWPHGRPCRRFATLRSPVSLLPKEPFLGSARSSGPAETTALFCGTTFSHHHLSSPLVTLFCSQHLFSIRSRSDTPPPRSEFERSACSYPPPTTALAAPRASTSISSLLCKPKRSTRPMSSTVSKLEASCAASPALACCRGE